MKPMNGRKRRRKPYGKMTVDELAAATAAYDQEDLSLPVPLRGEKLARYRRAMSRRGRPRIGKGSKAITVTLERGLLKRVDHVAQSRQISRSKLIALALSAHVRDVDSSN